MFFPAKASSKGRPGSRRLKVPSLVRVAAMLLIPFMLFASPLPQRIITAPDTAQAGPAPAFISPPTNLQLLPLDTTIHVNWTPSTDPLTAFHMVSVWDGVNLQQSKVVGRTSRAAQANGLLPNHQYTVKVYAMDAQGNLSSPITGVSTTDAQSPMRDAAFFENFNAPMGALDPDYFDVRSSQGTGQRPEDVSQADKFMVFNAEHHFHTEMIGGKERGELYIRSRVPMDLSDGMTRTFQTEFDISATQHSEGKWPEIHFVSAGRVPWSAEEFGAGQGSDLPNSLEFSVRADNGGSTSNMPQITVNINGVASTFRSTNSIFTPVNLRVPVVIKLSRTAAQFYINGQLVQSASGFNLPFTSGYWILAHRSWYSGRDRVTSPVINQVVHWDMFQFDGPAGSYNPVVKTYMQPGCSGVVRNEHGSITDCSTVELYQYRRAYTMTFTVADDPATARSAVLRFNGYSGNGTLDLNVNGHPMSLSVATGGYQNVLNSYDIPTTWLRQGANSLVFTSNPASNDSEISQIELETVFNRQRVMNTQMNTGPMPMLQVTANNFRIDHLLNDPPIYTATTYMYNLGGTQSLTYTAEVLNPKPYLTLSPASGTLVSPSYGGGVVPLNMRFDFTGVSTDDDGEVLVVRVNGGHMPVYIGVMIVAFGATTAPPYLTTFPLTTDFNKAAIPDYYGGSGATPTSTYTVNPQPTGTPTFTRTWTPTTTRTPTSTRTTTPLPTGTPTLTSTSTPALTATSTSLPSICEAVSWTNLVNVTATGNSLQKTSGGSGVWDAGAISTRAIQSGSGYVQATVDDTTTYKLFGLSNGNYVPSTADVQFALFMAGGTLKVYENGLLKGNFGTYAVGDALKVAVEGGVVSYYRNGTLLYISSAAPTYPMLVDTSINSLGGRITNVYICAANLGSNATFTPTPAPTNSPTVTSTYTGSPTPVYTPGITPTATITATPTAASEAVVWMTLVNVSATGNSIQKTSGAGSTWDAGASSTRAIAAGDGFAQASVDDATTYKLFGLNNGDTNATQADPDFALFMAGGTLKVYENGILRGNFGTYAIGDVLKVAVASGVVKYYRNGTLLYTSAVTPTYPLLLDTSINSLGGRVSSAYIGGNYLVSR